VLRRGGRCLATFFLVPERQPGVPLVARRPGRPQALTEGRYAATFVVPCSAGSSGSQT
jgi:hypothetical protein